MMGEQGTGQFVIKKEVLYIVLKIEDTKSLSGRQRRQLDSIQEQIQIRRRRQGRPEENRYIICNQDELYAEKVWQLILQGERDKLAKTAQVVPMPPPEREEIAIIQKGLDPTH